MPPAASKPPRVPPPADDEGVANERAARHWRGTTRITAALLIVWFVVTFAVAYFARDLNGIVLGWPFSFWVAAQGASIVYLVLVCVYARRMGREDDACGVTRID